MEQDMKKALDTQVGGGHYKDLAIQPVEYNHANGLGYLEGNVVKYVTRHRSKNGAQDIRKAIHYLELILQLEYADIDEMAFKHTPTEHETGEFDLGEPLTKEELSTENWYCLQHDEDAQKALVSLGVQVWDELLWEGGLWECCMLDCNKVAARPYAEGVLDGFMASHPDLYEIRLINGQFYRV